MYLSGKQNPPPHLKKSDLIQSLFMIMRGNVMKKYNITVNGTIYEVEVEEVANTPVAAGTLAAEVPAKKTVSVNTAVPPVKTEKPATAAVPAVSGAAGNIKINSPMPGNILKVNVIAGQKIKKGETLCLLEAMKMENEIVAPSDGIVVSVNTLQGTAVQTGELLFTLN